MLCVGFHSPLCQSSLSIVSHFSSSHYMRRECGGTVESVCSGREGECVLASLYTQSCFSLLPINWPYSHRMYR